MRSRSLCRSSTFLTLFFTIFFLAANAHAVPGTPCDPNAPSACDVCNSEQCVLNPSTDQDECAVFIDAVPNFDPTTVSNACPSANQAPGCWTGCIEEDIGDGFEIPDCQPNDDFCQGISGGDEANACRIGLCTGITPDVDNPSGCEYDLDPAADENCVLCISPEPVPFNHCGNGICEPVEGETCDNCGIDCNPAGYDAACLDQAAADNVCLDPAGIKLVTFFGPPYPTSGQLPGDQCEDGDLCTDNVCGTGGNCVITDKVCEPDADFCCAPGCEPPAAGGTCREVTGAPIPGCDPDCYVPEECPILIPTPTPTPTPPANQLIEGSGCSLGALAGSSSALAWIAGFGLLAAFGIRRRG